MSQITWDDLVATFVAECDENLSTLDQLLLGLEERPDDEETINTIFRCAHTLKGNAACLGYDVLAGIAHGMEDILDRLRARELMVRRELITLLLRGADLMRRLIPDVVAGREIAADLTAELLAELAAYDDDRSLSGSTVQKPLPAVSKVEHGERARSASGRIRVELQKLDLLLNVAMEIVISSGKARAAAESLPGNFQREVLLECLAETDRLFNELQEHVTRVRMVPVGPTFDQHKRTVRDVAQETGKEIRLIIEGADVEIDASLIEHIKDPLTHMVRNAVDHGIESPEARVRAGKDPCGTITLRARHEGGAMIIQIADDGAGLNRQRLLDRGRELGAFDVHDQSTDAEVFQLIFRAGLSTAEAVSDLSGRGVGMDVVHRNVAALRGTIDIESVEGRGTTFSIRLPLTLAILDGLAVEAGGERFLVPIQSVEECVELPALQRTDRPSGVMNLRGAPLPYVRLSHFYELPSASGTRENVVIVRNGGRLIGLVADRLVGEMKAVIKPVGRLFQGVPGVIGSTLFADGRVGLILDIAGIVRAGVEDRRAA